MIIYIIKRILSIIPVFMGVTLLCFFVIHLAPGKPGSIEGQMNTKFSSQTREKMMELYGLNRPVYVQYIDWLGRFIRFDFGNSFVDSRPVTTKIKERIGITVSINMVCLIIIFLVAMPLGVVSALKEGKFLDHFITVVVFIGFAIPGFWLALVLMSYFGVTLGWFPISGLESIRLCNVSFFERAIDVAHHLVIPIFVASFGSFAGLSRYVRTSMSNVLKQDYIRTAMAKGLDKKTVLFKHALRNALLPVITILGLSIPGLIGGSVIFETIFAIPGMGRLFYDSVMSRDYPVIMGVLVIGAILTLVGNLVADIAYAYADPRIRNN